MSGFALWLFVRLSAALLSFSRGLVFLQYLFVGFVLLLKSIHSLLRDRPYHLSFIGEYPIISCSAYLIKLQMKHQAQQEDCQGEPEHQKLEESLL